MHLHLPAGDWEALVLPLEADSPARQPKEAADENTDDAPGKQAGDRTTARTASQTAQSARDPADGHTEEAARLLDWATRQNRVLAAYIPIADVIPVALGAVFSGADALRAHLERHAPVLEQAAQAVAGRWQYLLQIRAEDENSQPPNSRTSTPIAPDGGGFLRQRQAQRDIRLHRAQDRQLFVQQLGTRINPLVSHALQHDVAGKELLADLSLLVPREATADLIAALSALSARSSALGLALRLIGPSPAYSFAAGPGAETRTTGTGGAHV